MSDLGADLGHGRPMAGASRGRIDRADGPARFRRGVSQHSCSITFRSARMTGTASRKPPHAGKLMAQRSHPRGSEIPLSSIQVWWPCGTPAAQAWPRLGASSPAALCETRTPSRRRRTLRGRDDGRPGESRGFQRPREPAQSSPNVTEEWPRGAPYRRFCAQAAGRAFAASVLWLSGVGRCSGLICLGGLVVPGLPMSGDRLRARAVEYLGQEVHDLPGGVAVCV